MDNLDSIINMIEFSKIRASWHNDYKGISMIMIVVDI